MSRDKIKPPIYYHLKCCFYSPVFPVGSLPDSMVHGANMRPTWGRQDPGGAHIDPMNIAIWAMIRSHDLSYDFVFLSLTYASIQIHMVFRGIIGSDNLMFNSMSNGFLIIWQTLERNHISLIRATNLELRLCNLLLIETVKCVSGSLVSKQAACTKLY